MREHVQRILVKMLNKSFLFALQLWQSSDLGKGVVWVFNSFYDSFFSGGKQRNRMTMCMKRFMITFMIHQHAIEIYNILYSQSKEVWSKCKYNYNEVFFLGL